LPREKSYSFFIVPTLLGRGFANGNEANIAGTIGPNDDHKGAEAVHADGNRPRLAYGRVVFDRDAERIQQDAVALGEGYAVLGEVRRILLRVELGTNTASICTLCIYVNPARADWKLT
jgi:hypothetical protein